jgi:ubiquinone/menaquinone biosynthesis C-methylase UbiE
MMRILAQLQFGPMADDLGDIRGHYGLAQEAGRLFGGAGLLERARTEELLRRALPPPPARVLDVGGGPGVYARWLVGLGYEVQLVDPVPLHVDQARNGTPPVGAELGDARRLAQADAGFDAVLLLGPLYHLTDRDDRVTALREARRVAVPGAPVFAAAISRFASLLDGLLSGAIDDPAFQAIVDRDLREGQHRNPTDQPRYFTTAYFHRPHELADEAREAGLVVDGVRAVEGPAWLAPDFEARWGDDVRRGQLLDYVRRVESEPELLAMSAHLLLTASAPAACPAIPDGPDR